MTSTLVENLHKTLNQIKKDYSFYNSEWNGLYHTMITGAICNEYDFKQLLCYLKDNDFLFPPHFYVNDAESRNSRSFSSQDYSFFCMIHEKYSRKDTQLSDVFVQIHRIFAERYLFEFDDKQVKLLAMLIIAYITENVLWPDLFSLVNTIVEDIRNLLNEDELKICPRLFPSDGWAYIQNRRGYLRYRRDIKTICDEMESLGVNDVSLDEWRDLVSFKTTFEQFCEKYCPRIKNNFSVH